MSTPVLQYLPSSVRDAARLAADLGLAAHAIEVHRFPDGELRTTVGPAAAMPAIADFLTANEFDAGTIIAGPDAESEPWVRDLANRLGAGFAIARKIRHGDRSVDMAFSDPGIFVGRPVILVDDIVSSGGTVLACAKALLAAGAKSVDAIVTHALFPPEMIAAFEAAGLRSVLSTHSVPHPTNAIELDTLLADALRREFTEAGTQGPAS